MIRIKHLRAKIKLHIELQVNTRHVTSLLNYIFLGYLVHNCVLRLLS
jgi:hypothetical protein